MKKLFALLMVAALLLSGCAATSEEDTQPSMEAPAKEINALPYELEFGQSHEKFAEIMEPHIGTTELKEANANDGYVSGHMPYLFSDGIEALEIETDDSDLMALYGTFNFSFNQDKELYEFYWFNTVESEAVAEKLLNLIIDQYVSRFGIEKMEEQDDQFLWKNDDYTVAVIYYESDDLLILIVHCNAFDLNH